MSAVLPSSNQRAFLGYGLGLRTTHYQSVLDELPPVDWFEILSENYMVDGGKPLYYLDQISAHYPIVMHGVSMSIGSADPLNYDYLARLKQLIDRVQPRWISDHLCWTGVLNKNSHDLLPLPYSEESIQHVADRVARVQDFLGRQMLLENLSSYVTYKASVMPEWEFLTAVCERADCLILLDINNIYVSARNHGFSAQQYLDGIPIDRVQQFHLAGHSDHGDYVVDTHDHDVVDSVWTLYAAALQRFGAVSTMIERDDAIPPLAELLQELDKARAIGDHVLAAQTRKQGVADVSVA